MTTDRPFFAWRRPATRAPLTFYHLGFFALQYFLLAFGAILLLQKGKAGLAIVWYANALAIAYLVEDAEKNWPPMLACVTVGSLLANGMTGHGLIISTAFTLSNLIEIVIAAQLVKIAGYQHSFHENPSQFISFLVMACSIPAALGATASATTIILHDPSASFSMSWITWFISATIGSLSSLPLWLVVKQMGAKRFIAAVQWKRSALWWLSISLISILVLLYIPFPLVYIAVPLAIASLRLNFESSLLVIWLSFMAIGIFISAGYFRMPAVATEWQVLLSYFPLLLLLTLTLLLTVSVDESRRILNTLAISESKLKTIYKVLPVGITITDPEGNIVDCNPASEVLLGVTREEHVRRHCAGRQWKIICPDGTLMSPEAFASVRALKEKRTVCDVEMGIVRPEGITWISVSAMPVEHPDYGVVVAYFNISDRKRAEETLKESAAQFQAIINASPVPFALSDQRLKIHYLNPAFVSLFGYTLEDIPTVAHWWPLAYPDPTYREWVINTWMDRLEESTKTGKSFELMEVNVRAKDGSIHTVMVGSTPLGAFFPSGMTLVTLYDVTDIRKAREAAEYAARVKSEFLANMSHEIRTPMTAVIGLSELALRSALSTETRSYLEKIHQSSHILLGILNDILDYSKIEAGRMTLENEPFALQSLVDGLNSLFSVRAVEKSLAFYIDVDPRIPDFLLGDSLRLQQVLSNLLGNAIKFTQEGHVALHVTVVRMGTAQIVLRWTVEDTGVGMSQGTIATLFQPFTQADGSISRRFGGTGLGLAISRELLALMGSDFTVHSMMGRGTAFIFEVAFGIPEQIPAHAMTHRTAPTAMAVLQAHKHHLAEKKVLVAEDNTINQQVIREFLRLSGIQAEIVNDGEEALTQLLKNPRAFHAVLMDVHMPNMDGIAATQKIRQHPLLATLPIIALTAGVTVEEREKVLRCGMNDFLSKPIDMETLMQTLSRWMMPTAQGRHYAESPQEKPFFEILGFDLRNLLLIVRDRDHLIEMLAAFAEDSRYMPDAIEKALINGDIGQAQRIMHQLKGVAGNVGAVTLHAAITQCDAALRQGQDIQPLLSTLRHAHHQALTAIADTQKKVPTLADRTISDRVFSLEKATQVQSLLLKMDLIPEELLYDLEQTVPITEHNLYQAFRRHLDQFDYPKAQQTLAQLIASATP